MKTYTLPQFKEALDRLEQGLRTEILGKVALAGGFQIEGQGKVNIHNTFKRKTGAFINNWTTKIVSAVGDRVEVHVSNNAIQSRIQELGGEIRPTRAEWLHWVDEDGQHHRAKMVTIPARPYLKPAAEDHVGKVEEAMRATLAQELERYIG